MMRDHKPTTTATRRFALAFAAGLLLTACGDPATDAGAEGADPEPAEESVEAPEPAEEAPEEEPADEAPAEDVEAPEAEEPAEEPAESPEEGEAAAGDCAIAVGDDGPLEEGAYQDLVGPINGSLEELVYELEASLVELEEGGDGPTLEAQLQEHRQTWEDLVEPVDGVTPPEGAEEWHDGLLASWVAVCDAIEDGYHGSADGDEERFEAFVDALRDFPSLVNELHANAACGPFEEC